MPFPRGVIDNDRLNFMKDAMALVCQRLELGEEDQANRQRVAFLLTGFVRAGEYNVDKLVDYVVDQFRRPIG
jgi:hypothetical protein